MSARARMTGTREFRNVPIAPYNISSFMGRIIYSDVFDKRFLFDYYFSNQLTLSNVVRSKWFSVSNFIRFEKKQQTVAVTVKVDGNRSSPRPLRRIRFSFRFRPGTSFRSCTRSLLVARTIFFSRYFFVLTPSGERIELRTKFLFAVYTSVQRLSPTMLL